MKSHQHLFDPSKRKALQSVKGATLIELLIVLAILAIISVAMILALNPRYSLLRAYDVERYHNNRQVSNALFHHLIDESKMAGGNAILEGAAHARPICKKFRSGGLPVTEEECAEAGGVSLAILPPEYLAELPVDRVVPEDDICTGYEVYQMVGRPIVTAPNLGKLPGDEPAGTCGCIVSTQDLLFHWNFDEGSGDIAHDSSPNGNHGFLQNPDASDWVTDIPPGLSPNNTALYFDGKTIAQGGDYIIVPDDESLRADADLTIAAWLKWEGPMQADAAVVLEKGEHDDDNYVMFVCSNQISQCCRNRASCGYEDSTNNLSFEFRSTGGNYHIVEAYNSKLSRVGLWQHTAIVFDDGDDMIRFYINGIETDNFPMPYSLDNSNNHPLWFGRQNYGSYQFPFKGIMDDIRIYKRALSEGEIRTLAGLQ